VRDTGSQGGVEAPLPRAPNPSPTPAIPSSSPRSSTICRVSPTRSSRNWAAAGGCHGHGRRICAGHDLQSFSRSRRAVSPASRTATLISEIRPISDSAHAGGPFPDLVNQTAHQPDRRWASSSLHRPRPAKNAGKAGQTSSEFLLSITRMWSWLQTSFLKCAYWSRRLTSVRVCVQPAQAGDFAAMNYPSFNFGAVVDGRRGVVGLHDRRLIGSWGAHTVGDEMSIVTYGLTDAGRKALKGGAQ
jgi:hypothetical protein